MSTPMEERLRAHYAERTENEPLPGPDTEESLARLLDRVESRPMRTNGSRRFPPRPLLVAAVVLVVCAVAGFVVARVEDDNRVSTTPDDDRPTPSTTVTQPPPQTSTTAPIPQSTAPPALPTPSAKSVVVAEFGALGWWDGTRWVAADHGLYPDGGVPVAGGEEYQILGLDGPISTGSGGWREGCQPDPLREVDAGIPPVENSPEAGSIAVTGVANPRPRPVRLLDPSAGPYRAAATEVLAGLGITDAAPVVAQVVAVDLDGDGADEVIVVAERISDPQGFRAQPGDYSVVFVRRVVDGSVRTTVVDHVAPHAVENQNPSAVIFRLASIADLNGDGRMEIAVWATSWESAGVAVHELRSDGTAPEVLEASCGV